MEEVECSDQYGELNLRFLYESKGDFEAEVRILTEREGGRKTEPRNGIRWDLRYFFQLDTAASMVWPEFIDDLGDAITPDELLRGYLKARFHIISRGMRDFHRQHAHPGVGFFCVEGARVCAAGVITRVTGLTADQ